MIEDTPHARLGAAPRRPTARPRLTLRMLHAPFAAADAGWADPFDPKLPADLERPPAMKPHSRQGLPRQNPAHKLVLLGIACGASSMALGYLGAAWLY